MLKVPALDVASKTFNNCTLAVTCTLKINVCLIDLFSCYLVLEDKNMYSCSVLGLRFEDVVFIF